MALPLLLGNTGLSVAREHYFVFSQPFPSLQCCFTLLLYPKSLYFTCCLFCVSLLPFTPPHSFIFIDFFQVACKHCVSRTTETSAFMVCVAPLNLSPSKVLGRRNSLQPNRLQIGVAVVFCCSTILKSTCWSQTYSECLLVAAGCEDSLLHKQLPVSPSKHQPTILI